MKSTKLKKIIFNLIKINLSILLVFMYSYIGAQTEEPWEYPVNSEPIQSIFPELYVYDISLDNSKLNASDVVSGGFYISNASNDITASGVSYKVQLVGDFDEGGFPLELFSSSDAEGPISISKNDKKYISFSYKLPGIIPSKDMGIQIQLLNSDGSPSTRAATKINILGETAPFLNTYYYLSIGLQKETFGALEGPIVKKGEVPTGVFEITNTRKNNVYVRPHVEIYEGLDSGKIVDSFYGDYVSIDKDKSLNKEIEFPTFSYKPGVYTAIVKYVDENEVPYTEPMEIRYLIDGLKPKIGNVDLTTLDLGNSDNFGVVVSFYDVPLAPRSSNKESETTPNNITAEVAVYNEGGILLDEQTIDFPDGEYTSEATFEAFTETTVLDVKVKLLENGVQIDNHDYKFEVTPKEKKSFFVITKTNAIITIVFILLLAVLLFINKKRSVKLQ